MANLNPEWVRSGIKKETISWANEFGTYLAEGTRQEKLSTTQLRNFFGEIKRIQIRLGFDNGFQEESSNILMLKPKLAYAVGRAEKNKDRVRLFFEQLSKGLDAINTENPIEGKKHFENFVKLMEAVVAYHKAKGGE